LNIHQVVWQKAIDGLSEDETKTVRLIQCTYCLSGNIARVFEMANCLSDIANFNISGDIGDAKHQH
jgi:hypothetical protein